MRTAQKSEVLGQEAAAGVRVELDLGQLRPDQAEQVSEGALLAAVRGRGHQQQMAVGRGVGDAPQQLVAELVLRGGTVVGGDAGVGFVDGDQVGAVPDEVTRLGP
ncbi:hypothetical protein [Microbispora triticiradicis]|uniref:hypothetical protein n=1 Tax=Microbispora triticiradicis TaxID=2200763 RepID=UPI0014052669|nr:hypothetical protein [Microbispora triticiradicis]